MQLLYIKKYFGKKVVIILKNKGYSSYYDISFLIE